MTQFFITHLTYKIDLLVVNCTFFYRKRIKVDIIGSFISLWRKIIVKVSELITQCVDSFVVWFTLTPFPDKHCLRIFLLKKMHLLKLVSCSDFNRGIGGFSLR